MLRPFLLIGVGGSGGKTLRIVRNELARKLDEHRWTGGFPLGWQFLHIDVPTQADGDDPDLPPQLPQGEYCGLVAAGLNFKILDSAVAGTGRTREGDAIAGWRPDAGQVHVPVAKGAGQYRAIGREIAIASLQKIKQDIDAAIRAINGMQVTAQMQELTVALGGTPAPIPHAPVALVVSSIAGGSGAGAVVDVCDVLRATGEQWADQSIGILFCPDVFDYLPAEQRRGTRPNALAAVSELLAGYWGNAGPSQASQDIMSLYGVALGDTDRLGPRYPFLVGAKNDSVSYRTQNEVYHAMGRSLSSWVASVELQDKIDAYVAGNWSQTAIGVPDALRLKTDDMESPFSALGSARVGLGRDRYREYAIERLARVSVERLLLRHEDLRARGDERPSKAIAKDVADNAFGAFLVSTQLNERTEQNNDILDAIRPEGRNEVLKSLSGEIVGLVTANAPEKGRPVAEWRALISQRIRDNMDRRLDEFDVENKEAGRAWVAFIQANLKKTVAAAMARDGLVVTGMLLRKLVEELTLVKEELQQEAARHSRSGENVDQLIEQSLRKAGGDKLLAAHPQIAGAVKFGIGAINDRAEARLRELVVHVIPDLIDNLIVPMAEEVERAGSALHEQFEPSSGQASMVSVWPDRDDVPLRLRPAANEFVLEPPETYPTTLQTILQNSFPGFDRDDALTQSVQRVIVGAEEVVDDKQEAVRQVARWVPRSADLQAELATAARASFDIHVSTEDLLARAKDWVTRGGTPSGSYVTEGLNSYLAGEGVDPSETARRVTRFEGQFGAAVDAAQPLVGIKAQALVLVHGRDSVPSQLFFSEFPLSARSDAGQAVRRVLEAKDLWRAEMDNAFVQSDRSVIDVFSVLSEPYQPAVFDSLMRPMAADWGKQRQNPDTRKEFWRWRRARNLEEFIPIAPAVRRAMVRGWFTASLLGQVRDLGESASIYVPNDVGGNGRWFEFPNPLLAGVLAARYELMPAILESIPLAFLSVNVDASLDPIRPYQRLRAIGTSASGGGTSYESMNAELEQWIGNGKLPQGAPTPEIDTAGDAGGDWDKRRDVVEHRLEALLASYQGLFDEQERRQEHAVVRAFELRRDISASLDDLLDAVQRFDLSGSGLQAW